MPARRFRPLLVWTLVLVGSVIVLAASFAYAAQVGDPTVREDAQRRPRRPTPADVTTVPGFGGGGFGSGGVGSPGLGSQGLGAGGTFAIDTAALERAIPPATCMPALQDLAGQDVVTLAEARETWDAAEACAASQGQPTMPALEALTPDPLSQQCVAATLVRTALFYRSPTVPAAGLDRLMVDCQARGIMPALPGFPTGGSPQQVLPPGAGPVRRTPSSGEVPATPSTTPGTAPGAAVTTAPPPTVPL